MSKEIEPSGADWKVGIVRVGDSLIRPVVIDSPSQRRFRKENTRVEGAFLPGGSLHGPFPELEIFKREWDEKNPRET